MSTPTPIDRGSGEPSLGDWIAYPGLDVLTNTSSFGLLPVEMAYLRYDGRTYHLLRVSRAEGADGPYVAWIERLAVSRDGSVTTDRPRRLRHTLRFAATPHEAANAASIAAGWIHSGDLASDRRLEQQALAWAAGEKQRAVTERRHLKPVQATAEETGGTE